MFIYLPAAPENPTKLGQILYVSNCNPVVAKDTFAFVPQRKGTRCGIAVDALFSCRVKYVDYLTY
ncbi:MAG: hypothetical protein H7101_12050 [Deinococcales bacterium]|nr:hypothetical protein [Chitinophagaceae bacterium]